MYVAGFIQYDIPLIRKLTSDFDVLYYIICISVNSGNFSVLKEVLDSWNAEDSKTFFSTLKLPELMKIQL